MDDDTLRKMLAEAFVSGGRWAEQFRTWNAEISTADADRALTERAPEYAVEILPLIPTS